MTGYPVILERDTNGTFRVEVVDIPEANAVGEDEADALRNAVEAIETALEMYAEQRRPIPPPSTPKNGQATVHRPPATRVAG